MGEENFALIVVGIVAIVAVVGLLNLSGGTGRVVTAKTAESIVLEDGTLAWCSLESCNNANGVDCKFISTDIGKSCSKVYVSQLGHTYTGYYKP